MNSNVHPIFAGILSRVIMPAKQGVKNMNTVLLSDRLADSTRPLSDSDVEELDALYPGLYQKIIEDFAWSLDGYEVEEAVMDDSEKGRRDRKQKLRDYKREAWEALREKGALDQ